MQIAMAPKTKLTATQDMIMIEVEDRPEGALAFESDGIDETVEILEDVEKTTGIGLSVRDGLKVLTVVTIIAFVVVVVVGGDMVVVLTSEVVCVVGLLTIGCVVVVVATMTGGGGGGERVV